MKMKDTIEPSPIAHLEGKITKLQHHGATLHAELIKALNELIVVAPTEEARNEYRTRLSTFV